jgi:hypothetical protein
MAWTYSGNPADSDRDRLRFETGDTDTNSQLLQDAELDFVIAQESTWARRIARCLRSIGHKLLQQPNFALDRWREDRHEVAKSFLERARELEKTGKAAGVYAGGISTSDKDTQKDDEDYDQPFASLTMDENQSEDTDELVSSVD